MALIACPDCQTEVSDQAPACPKCGRPLAAEKSVVTKDLGFGGFIYALLVLAGIVITANGAPAGLLLVAAGGVLLLARLKIWSGVARK